MLNELFGAVVAILLVALAAVAHTRGQMITGLQEALLQTGARAEKAEKAEADIKAMIEHYSGRPFVININDAQIVNLAQMIVAAIPKTKSTFVQ